MIRITRCYIFTKMEEIKMEILKVSSKSKPNSVAGAIAGVVRDQGCVELQSIGAGSVNQAMKAIAIAAGYLAPTGVNLVSVPAFINVRVDDEDRTGMKILVTDKNRI